ncbi:hypothetical protein [Streptomyces sp. NBC_01244]|uniref:hypothetical protein n=1 Tax=Streptomyces sp. NBC_01244 TaxID=2903797 RepID=UPI002E0E09BB|nr:hypothetical protein OG247_34050 [Streptomyces sp. NBC_01244]
MRRHTPLLGRLLEQLATVRVLDCATRLAARAFLGALPAVLVAAAVAPDWLQDELVSSIRATLGLQDAALDEVRAVYSATDPTTVAGTSGVGILLSATAAARVCLVPRAAYDDGPEQQQTRRAPPARLATCSRPTATPLSNLS